MLAGLLAHLMLSGRCTLCYHHDAELLLGESSKPSTESVAALLKAEDADFKGFTFDGREEHRVEDEGGDLATHARNLFDSYVNQDAARLAQQLAPGAGGGGTVYLTKHELRKLLLAHGGLAEADDGKGGLTEAEAGAALAHMELASKASGKLEYDEFWIWLSNKGGLLPGTGASAVGLSELGHGVAAVQAAEELPTIFSTRVFDSPLGGELEAPPQLALDDSAEGAAPADAAAATAAPATGDIDRGDGGDAGATSPQPSEEEERRGQQGGELGVRLQAAQRAIMDHVLKAQQRAREKKALAGAHAAAAGAPPQLGPPPKASPGKGKAGMGSRLRMRRRSLEDEKTAKWVEIENGLELALASPRSSSDKGGQGPPAVPAAVAAAAAGVGAGGSSPAANARASVATAATAGEREVEPLQLQPEDVAAVDDDASVVVPEGVPPAEAVREPNSKVKVEDV